MKKIIAEKDMRLDSFLSKHLNIARNQVENFIKVTGVLVNDKKINKCGYKLKNGDTIFYEITHIAKDERGEYEVDFDVEILYEDSELLVINKPPFLTVHPAPSVKEATLVDWLSSKNYSLSTISGKHRNGIVHRIDKETSGALVVAKTNDAHSKLSAQLQDKSMGRYYLALITPPLKEDITIESFIARNPKNRLKMKSGDKGKYAKSRFIKLLTSKDAKYELIAIKLYTGRTHQIRAHLESLSRSIVGDTTYGFKSKKDKIVRVLLHAYIIYFTHPKIGKKLFVKAPLFLDMQSVLEKQFVREELYEKISTDYILDRFSSTF
jgi:23S rRNA pseudouridine1911/1915/1917 synthase